MINMALGIIAVFALIIGVVLQYVGLHQDSTLWVGIPLGIAAASGLLWMLINVRSIFRFVTSRSARYGVNMFLVTVIVGFIAVMANVLLSGNSPQWDTTSNRRHSLSLQSVRVVEDLDQDVMVTANIPEAEGLEAYMGTRLAPQQFEAQMQMYRAASNRVSYRTIDARRQPELTEGLPGPIAPGDIFVTIGEGDDARTVKVEPYGSGNLEEKITRALIDVTREDQKTVYFVTRQGDDLFDREQARGIALGQLRAGLESETYEIETIDLLEAEEIPEDCAVLFIADVTYQFTTPDLVVLSDYINRGGQVVIAIDIEPVLGGMTDSPLVSYLAQFGCVVGKDVIIEQDIADISLGGRVEMGYSAEFSPRRLSQSSDITRDLIDPLFVSYARSVTTDDLPRGVDAETLAMAGDGSWAEQSLDLFRRGMASPQTSTLRGRVPLAQILTIDTEEFPARAPEAETRQVEGAPTSLTLATPEEQVPAFEEPTGPLPVSDTEAEMDMSIDEQDSLVPGGAVEDDLGAMTSDSAEEEPESTPLARIVVLGDVTMLADGPMVPGRTGNRDFVLNAVNYLASETDLISIRPRDTVNTGFTLSEQDVRILIVLLLLLPLAVAVTGTVITVRRRRLA